MESIGKLTGGVAHDFNNLLQIISGNLQLLQAEIAPGSKAERRITNAMAGVQRGAKLASQLLAFGRRQPLEPKVVNIGRLVGGMEDLLRRSIGEGVEMETVVSPSLWNAFADPTQVENAVLNLAINARDAMDGIGKLTIEVRNSHLDHDYSQQNPGVDPGQYVMLAVSDTGSGMPPELIERVFEPFFTTKAEGKGSGLGLSMVYGFTKQSGGHVKIYSEVGEGTTVRLYLPRVHESEDVAAGPELVEAGGGSETILVVEDDAEVRTIATEMLRELGYKVLTAKDAASAVPILESGMKIDLLFTDVVMPGPIRSPELARKAKELIPGIAILFTSGYTENAIVHGGRLDPGVNLLTKPYSRQALAMRIRDALKRSTQPA
jgi:CheY-like chemotaxis protein